MSESKFEIIDTLFLYISSIAPNGLLLPFYALIIMSIGCGIIAGLNISERSCGKCYLFIIATTVVSVVILSAVTINLTVYYPSSVDKSFTKDGGIIPVPPKYWQNGSYWGPEGAAEMGYKKGPVDLRNFVYSEEYVAGTYISLLLYLASFCFCLFGISCISAMAYDYLNKKMANRAMPNK